jgi:hypothetical protein
MDVTDEHPRPSHKTRKAGPPVRGVWTVSGKTFEGSAGGIFVINAGEVTASRRSAIHHSYNSTFTSAPASSKRTYRAMRTDEITVSGRAGRVPHPFAFCAKGGMAAPAFRVFCEGRGFYAFSLRFNFGRLPIRSRLRAVHCDSISTTLLQPEA